MPDGKRRRALGDAAPASFNEDFAERAMSFDGEAADAYAEIGAARRVAGRPISQFDAMIAGMTRSHGAIIATRNGNDFEECGVDVVDPWSA